MTFDPDMIYWINIYLGGQTHIWHSQEDADLEARHKGLERMACLKFKQGDGLPELLS